MSLTDYFRELFGKVSVLRGKKEILITRHPLLGKLITATYDIHTGSLQLFQFSLFSKGVSYFDTNYDGKIEEIIIGNRTYKREEDETAFLEADKKLAEYKKLLNIDENVEIALRKRSEQELSDLINE